MCCKYFRVNQSPENIVCSRKRVSNVPHHMTAPAAKKDVSENVNTRSGLTEAPAGLHCSIQALLPMSENSPLPSSPGTTESKNCSIAMSDSFSDDSDDSTCTLDSGVETDDGKISRRPAKRMKPSLPVVFDFVEGSNSSKNLHGEDGFVRRMANLNARARVAVFFQCGKYKKNRQPSSTKVNAETATNENEPNALIKTSENVSSSHFDVQTHVMPSTYGTANSSLKVDAMDVCHLKNSTETTHNEDFQSEGFPCNSLGLLYDGRTVHPQLRILLQDGKIPFQIIPLIVPAAMSFVYDHARHVTNQETGTKSLAVRKARRVSTVHMKRHSYYILYIAGRQWMDLLWRTNQNCAIPG